MLKVEANPWDVSDPLFQIPLSITCFFCHLPQPTTNDNFGGRNNVITVKKSDFEVFEALDCDANASVCSGSMSEYSTLWIYINAVYHKLQDLLSTGLLFHRGFHIYDTDDLRSSCVDLCWVAKQWKTWVNSCVNLSSILLFYLFLFRGFHQAQLHFTNIYNRYESKDEGSANGHEVPARQTPKYIDNITFKTDKNTRDSTTENSVDGPAVGANSFPCPWAIRVKVIV